MERININGHYLIIAPKSLPAYGYHHMLTERAYLVDNILNFFKNHPDIHKSTVTVYELREVNERSQVTESDEGKAK